MPRRPTSPARTTALPAGVALRSGTARTADPVGAPGADAPTLEQQAPDPLERPAGPKTAYGDSRRYLSDSSYWVYLAHMPVVVLLGGALSTTDLPATLKVLLACVGTTAFSLVTYQCWVRHTAIGELVNGSRVRVEHSAGSNV